MPSPGKGRKEEKKKEIEKRKQAHQEYKEEKKRKHEEYKEEKKQDREKYKEERQRDRDEYNPIDAFRFAKPTEDVTETFMNYLEKNRVNARLRRSRGKDIDAACGQLANKN